MLTIQYTVKLIFEKRNRRKSAHIFQLTDEPPQNYHRRSNSVKFTGNRGLTSANPVGQFNKDLIAAFKNSYFERLCASLILENQNHI